MHSPAAGAPLPWRKNPDVLFVVGIVGWLVAIAWHWPTTLSFADEIGYVGQAKLLLSGRIHPEAASPGVWTHLSTGVVSQYPMLVSCLVAPLFALAPRGVFLTGLLAALGLAFTVSRALKAWELDPRWGLLVLADPTIIILSRTVMSDLILSAFAVGSWWALRRGRAVLSILLFAATMCTKPTGFLIAAAIVVGEVLTSRDELRQRRADAVHRALIGASAFAVGLASMLAMNKVAAGRLWFTYDHRFLGTPPFWPKYFRSTAPLHAQSLLLNPPLLIVGLLTFLRRQLFGPLLMILGLGTMMCFYFFVDQTSTWAETIVLSQRLILPAVAFLLVGYTALLAGLARRLRLTKAANVVLMVLPAVLAFEIGGIHQRWQAPKTEALAAATRAQRAAGAGELGLTYNAMKAGLLYPGRTSIVNSDDVNMPDMILCATRGMSYRQPGDGERCDFPGYARATVADGYVLLTRAPP